MSSNVFVCRVRYSVRGQVRSFIDRGARLHDAKAVPGVGWKAKESASTWMYAVGRNRYLAFPQSRVPLIDFQNMFIGFMTRNCKSSTPMLGNP